MFSTYASWHIYLYINVFYHVFYVCSCILVIYIIMQYACLVYLLIYPTLSANQSTDLSIYPGGLLRTPKGSQPFRCVRTATLPFHHPFSSRSSRCFQTKMVTNSQLYGCWAAVSHLIAQRVLKRPGSINLRSKMPSNSADFLFRFSIKPILVLFTSTLYH